MAEAKTVTDQRPRIEHMDADAWAVLRTAPSTVQGANAPGPPRFARRQGSAARHERQSPIADTSAPNGGEWPTASATNSPCCLEIHQRPAARYSTAHGPPHPPDLRGPECVWANAAPRRVNGLPTRDGGGHRVHVPGYAVCGFYNTTTRGSRAHGASTFTLSTNGRATSWAECSVAGRDRTTCGYRPHLHWSTSVRSHPT